LDRDRWIGQRIAHWRRWDCSKMLRRCLRRRRICHGRCVVGDSSLIASGVLPIARKLYGSIAPAFMVADHAVAYICWRF